MLFRDPIKNSISCAATRTTRRLWTIWPAPTTPSLLTSCAAWTNVEDEKLRDRTATVREIRNKVCPSIFVYKGEEQVLSSHLCQLKWLEFINSEIASQTRILSWSMGKYNSGLNSARPVLGVSEFRSGTRDWVERHMHVSKAAPSRNALSIKLPRLLQIQEHSTSTQ